jgi:hypothetical protein
VRCIALALALAGLLPGAARAEAADELLHELQGCERRLDPQLDVGYDRIAALCPVLVARLAASRWAPVLPQGWNRPDNDLSAGGLVALATWIERQRQARPLRDAPATQLLAQVLRELQPATTEQSGAWARFKRWLRAIFAARETEPGESWLQRLLRGLDPAAIWMRVLGYAALAVVVALAVLIVANELRAAGLLRSSRRAPSAAGPAPAQAHARPTLRDFERSAARERPAVLLRLVTDALTRAERLPPAGSLTVREVVRAARIDAGAEREHLRRLTEAAERARFAASEPSEAEIAPALAGGRRLLAALESAGSGR